MDRVVARIFIDEWVDKNGPDGLVKLAQKAGVSYSLLNKARNGLVPKKTCSRLKISKALGLKEEQVFPVLAHRKKAS
jgi:hypothetical protein